MILQGKEIMESNKMIIAIEGVPGAGKTTAVGVLASRLAKDGKKVKVFYEQFDKDMLDLFLTNPQKYGMAFQMSILISRKNIHLKALKYHEEGYFVIIDRSVIGDLAFCNLHVRKKNIDEDTRLDYINIVNKIPKLDLLNVFYLAVSPECAINRIRKRGRPGEEDVYDVEYLSTLDECHRQVFTERNVHIVDWNLDTDVIDDLVDTIIDRL